MQPGIFPSTRPTAARGLEAQQTVQMVVSDLRPFLLLRSEVAISQMLVGREAVASVADQF